MAKRGFIQRRFAFSFFGQHRFGSVLNRPIIIIVVKQPRKLPKLISAISKVRGFTFCLK
jgi:hypothetical protein